MLPMITVPPLMFTVPVTGEKLEVLPPLFPATRLAVVSVPWLNPNVPVRAPAVVLPLPFALCPTARLLRLSVEVWPVKSIAALTLLVVAALELSTFSAQPDVPFDPLIVNVPVVDAKLITPLQRPAELEVSEPIEIVSQFSVVLAVPSVSVKVTFCPAFVPTSSVPAVITLAGGSFIVDAPLVGVLPPGFASPIRTSPLEPRLAVN